MRKRNKKSELKLGETPGWVVTFGDMMSLLLCFFVAIVSFSNIEIERYRAAMGSFRGALQSPFSSPGEPSGSQLPALSESMNEAQEAVETAAEVRRVVEQLDSPAGIETEATPEGVRITLSNPVMFDEGTDALKSGAVTFLLRLSEVIRRRDPAGVLIEGHTDDTPIRTVKFPSNWELSAARALAVLKLFQQTGLPPEKLVAIGYGEYRPREPLPKSANSAEKAVNRRVEILLQLQSERISAATLPREIPARKVESGEN